MRRGLVALTAAAAMLCACSPSSTDQAQTEQLGAFDACKHFVGQELKAPGSAKFRDFFGDQAPTITGSGKGPYTVVSTVDSQNSFGAQLRSSFTCTVRDDGSSWHLEDIHVDDGGG